MNNKVYIAAIAVLTFVTTSCGGGGKKDVKDAPQATAEATSTKKTILFFGDSLTAGYGLDDVSQAYPAVVQKKIDSAKLDYTVVNSGVSGETSAGGLGRIDWILKQPVDIFVLELGANDGLRGLPVSSTESNLQQIIDKLKAKYPKAKIMLLGMQVPPNMGGTYAKDFKDMFPNLAKKNNITLVPFLLQGVGGVRSLNQADGIHPTAEGAKILASNVWSQLKGLL